MATATATIKKVSGYMAPDGSHHPTAKAAADYVQQQAIIKAVDEAFGDDALEGYTRDNTHGVEFTENETPVLYSGGVAKFLLANREQILAALQPKVTVRQRAPRKAKPAAAAGTQA